MGVYSDTMSLQQLRDALSKYLSRPFFAHMVPGQILENSLAEIRHGTVLKTYDFVDVINHNSNCGWQAKSTKEQNPLTWARVKISDRQLIDDSHDSTKLRQQLGDAILQKCNAHVEKSIKKYELTEVGYARLIIHSSNHVTYFERLLCTKTRPMVFNPDDFIWSWSTGEKITKKGSSPALWGIHKPTNKKWWAWYGLAGNQLHFIGEKNWWPRSTNKHCIQFKLPD